MQDLSLEEVYLFHEILEETQDNFSEGLVRYQNLREADIAALIRLVQFSYPWQYNQDLFQKQLWSINFFLRFLLSRLFPFLFNPHAFLLIQNYQLSYSEILEKSNRKTRYIFILLVLVIFALIVMIKTFNL